MSLQPPSAASKRRPAWGPASKDSPTQHPLAAALRCAALSFPSLSSDSRYGGGTATLPPRDVAPSHQSQSPLWPPRTDAFKRQAGAHAVSFRTSLRAATWCVCLPQAAKPGVLHFLAPVLSLLLSPLRRLSRGSLSLWSPSRSTKTATLRARWMPMWLACGRPAPCMWATWRSTPARSRSTSSSAPAARSCASSWAWTATHSRRAVSASSSTTQGREQRTASSTCAAPRWTSASSA